MALKRGIFVVAGYGAGKGTGSASADAFAKLGYKIAILGRDRGDDSLQKGAESIKSAGGDAAAFPVQKYDTTSFHTAFSSIKTHWPSETIRVALWNASHGTFKPFLDIPPEEWAISAEVNMIAPAAFSKEVLTVFKSNDLLPNGARGTLLFTGATASIRGNVVTSSFSAGKHALRALSQSLAKEFNKENIHVAHAIIDGGILTDRSAGYKSKEWLEDKDARLTPEGIADAYVYLVGQDRGSWTWELDLRPAHEKW